MRLNEAFEPFPTEGRDSHWFEGWSRFSLTKLAV
jgi:hypothetical protein